jgi:hypothetical protein
LYAKYWQGKLSSRPIEFPSKLCPAIADITGGFSFAYLQELFIAAMLVIARGEAESSDSEDKDDDSLDQYKLWRVLKKQAAILREDMGSGDEKSAEPVTLLRETEPHLRTDKDYPFSPSANGLRLTGKASYKEGDEWPRIMQAAVGRRLTPQQALNSLQKDRTLGDKVWEWGPSLSDYL